MAIRRCRPDRLATCAAALLAIAAPGGCARPISPICDPGDHSKADADVDFGAFQNVPRPRTGSLPFPGMFTLYTAADPTELGRHSYSAQHEEEAGRGILYARRAGFIDLCHVRLSADLVAYALPRIRHALAHDWPCVRLRGQEPSVYRIEFHYPASWWTIDRAERAELIDELSIRVAQRIAFTMATWHEILTWFGYKSTVVISEHGSAFTYEETPSHAIGIQVGGAALRAPEPYDEAVAAALEDALRELGVVGRDELRRALDAVRGVWWADGATLRRHLDIGQDDGVIEPWLVPGFAAVDAVAFRLPSLEDVGGHDFSGLDQVSIDPNVLEAPKIRAALPGSPETIVPREHFPILIERIRDEVGESMSRPD